MKHIQGPSHGAPDEIVNLQEQKWKKRMMR
uniref:Uncharacterized protein n=1 Tax=Arundo donax TaxID=35708 RepID=A0A0A9EET2_ARUDO